MSDNEKQYHKTTSLADNGNMSTNLKHGKLP